VSIRLVVQIFEIERNANREKWNENYPFAIKKSPLAEESQSCWKLKIGMGKEEGQANEEVGKISQKN